MPSDLADNDVECPPNMCLLGNPAVSFANRSTCFCGKTATRGLHQIRPVCLYLRYSCGVALLHSSGWLQLSQQLSTPKELKRMSIFVHLRLPTLTQIRTCRLGKRNATSLSCCPICLGLAKPRYLQQTQSSPCLPDMFAMGILG
jgi:hypothetical protein